jgi:hypothetical protein
MPPAKKPRPPTAELNAALAAWSGQLTAWDSARQERECRSRLRRLNRVEFENSQRDLLAMPALNSAANRRASSKPKPSVHFLAKTRSK